jgi:hypothetical protein
MSKRLRAYAVRGRGNYCAGIMIVAHYDEKSAIQLAQTHTQPNLSFNINYDKAEELPTVYFRGLDGPKILTKDAWGE